MWIHRCQDNPGGETTYSPENYILTAGRAPKMMGFGPEGKGGLRLRIYGHFFGIYKYRLNFLKG